MNVKIFRMWYGVTSGAWMYDTGPGTEVNRAVRVLLLTTCHTELKATTYKAGQVFPQWPEAPDGWLQAFDVHIMFDPATNTLTVKDSGQCNK